MQITELLAELALAKEQAAEAQRQHAAQRKVRTLQREEKHLPPVIPLSQLTIVC